MQVKMKTKFNDNSLRVRLTLALGAHDERKSVHHTHGERIVVSELCAILLMCLVCDVCFQCRCDEQRVFARDVQRSKKKIAFSRAIVSSGRKSNGEWIVVTTDACQKRYASPIGLDNCPSMWSLCQRFAPLYVIYNDELATGG